MFSFILDIFTSKSFTYLLCDIHKFQSERLLRIFLTHDKQIDVEVLKATSSKGVDIVVNAENEKQVKQSASSLKEFGVFIHLSPNDIVSKFKLGK